MKRKEARYANGKRIYKAFFGLVVVSCVSEASRLVTSASGNSQHEAAMRCMLVCHFTERSQPMAYSVSLRLRFWPSRVQQIIPQA